MRFGKFDLKRESLRRIGWLAGGAGLFLFTMCLIIAAVGWISAPTPISFAVARSRYHPSDVWVLDRDGRPIESLRTRQENRSLGWVALDEVGLGFRELLLQAEDRHFYEHAGVDAPALMRGMWMGLTGGPRRGASTLSMQLVKLLHPGPTPKTRLQAVSQKFLQIFSALRLERNWSKNEILEAYLNLVSFRGELVGLRAASLGYFNKNPRGLGGSESALLVALLRAPNATAEKIGQRAAWLLPEESRESTRELARQTFTHPYTLSRARNWLPVFNDKLIVAG
jgi:penicillin-binding protein 1C